jgi:hypothetical protein
MLAPAGEGVGPQQRRPGLVGEGVRVALQLLVREAGEEGPHRCGLDPPPVAMAGVGQRIRDQPGEAGAPRAPPQKSVEAVADSHGAVEVEGDERSRLFVRLAFRRLLHHFSVR